VVLPTRVVVTIIVRGAEALRDEAIPPPYSVDVEMEPAKRTTRPPVDWPLGSTTVRMGARRRLLAAGAATLVAALLVATALMRHSGSDPAAASLVPTRARTWPAELAAVNGNDGSPLGPAELAAVNSGVGPPLGPADPVRPELRGPLVGPPNVWSAAIPTTAAGSPPDPAADATSCHS